MKFFYSKVFIKQLFLATIIFSLIVLASIVFLFFYTNQTSRVVVPDLVGVSINEIDELINENNLRYEIIDSSRFDPKREPLSVISHLPSPGSEVKENRKIYFTVNPSGFKKTTVPNLIQITKRNAESIIKSSGFEIGDYTYRDNIGKDMVLEIRFKGNKIEPGILLPRTSKIDLVLGNGRR